jgi:beta-lactamase superfamily II metal-dependent hydrolase
MATNCPKRVERRRGLPVGLLLDGGEATAQTADRREIAAVARARGVRRVPSDVGQRLRAGPITARVLWPRRAPTAAAGADANLRATVLLVRDGGFDLLLSADAESDVLSRLTLRPVAALKVPTTAATTPACRRCSRACARRSP